jgi:glutamine synthetase
VSSGELVALVCCDLGAIVRGRTLFSSALDARLAEGVSWVPANHALTPLGPVAEPNPFGSTGDLRLAPDAATRVRVEGDPGASALDLVLCDIVETDGGRWEACPRSFLRDTLELLERELGARVMASFEHEFQLLLDTPPALPFSLEAQRRAEPFATRVMNALVAAGVEPERFLPEYAAHQFEIPLAAAEGLASADRAVVFREVVREIARRLQMRASFVPLLDPAGAGNGVHIHLSLLDAGGRSLLYDASRACCLSELGECFAAGVLRHARALSALTAASPVSAARLAPHRWSAGAVCLADRSSRSGAATPNASYGSSTAAPTRAQTPTSPWRRSYAPAWRAFASGCPPRQSSMATPPSSTRRAPSATASARCRAHSRSQCRRSPRTTRRAPGSDRSSTRPTRA